MIIIITTNRVFTDVRLNFKQLRLTAVSQVGTCQSYNCSYRQLGFGLFTKVPREHFQCIRKNKTTPDKSSRGKFYAFMRT